MPSKNTILAWNMLYKPLKIYKKFVEFSSDCGIFYECLVVFAPVWPNCSRAMINSPEFFKYFFLLFLLLLISSKNPCETSKKNTSRFSSHVFIAHVFLINSSKSREKNRSRFSKDANIAPINYFYRIPKAIHVIHNVRMVKMNEIHLRDVSHVWSAFETVEQ